MGCSARKVLLKDYYSLLGVSPTASASEIQRAFRRLALEFHPDVSRKLDAEARFQEINTAYQVLKNPARRAEYDASRSPLARQPGRVNQRDVRRYYFQRRVRAATDPGSTWNYYDVLGVPKNATEETVARAFQRLYGQFYPGKNIDPGTDAILREIVEARDVLTNQTRRAAYDRLPPDQQPPGRPFRQSRANAARRRARGTPGQHRRSAAPFALAVGVPLLALAVGAVVVWTL